jgi:hypothetical protein
MIPHYGIRGQFASVYYYNPHRAKGQGDRYWHKTLGCHLYGLQRLGEKRRSGQDVFLCEGPFDAIALDSAMTQEERANNIVVAMPGRFDKHWQKWFAGRRPGPTHLIVLESL